MLTAEQAQSLASEQFERLAEGKQWGLMWLGLLVAVAAEDVFDVVNAAILGDGILSPYLARQTERSLAYYADPQEWRCEFLAALGVPDRRIVTIETLYACLLAGNVQIQPSDLAHGRRLATFARRKIDTDVLELDGTALDQIDWAEALKRESVVWFFRTAIPCWILHGRWPWRMLHEVTAGTRYAMKSVIDLIRIDKRAIHLPAITAFLHDGPAHLVSGRLKKASDALRSRPRKITHAKVKCRLGRFIQDVQKAQTGKSRRLPS